MALWSQELVRFQHDLLLSRNRRVVGDLALDRFMGTYWKAGVGQLGQSLGSSRHLYRSADDPASRNSPLLADGDE